MANLKVYLAKLNLPPRVNGEPGIILGVGLGVGRGEGVGVAVGTGLGVGVG